MNPPIQRNLSVDEFASWAGIGRTKVYEEIGSGRLKTAKIGRRRLVPTSEAARWLEAHMTHVAA